jgi:hypothetical protein
MGADVLIACVICGKNTTPDKDAMLKVLRASTAGSVASLWMIVRRVCSVMRNVIQ